MYTYEVCTSMYNKDVIKIQQCEFIINQKYMYILTFINIEHINSHLKLKHKYFNHTRMCPVKCLITY